jgi:glycosyltransferase involved in cell wall biosynthesis
VALDALRLARRLRPDLVCSFTSEAVLVIPICNLLKIPSMVYLPNPELSGFRLRSWEDVRKLRYTWRKYLQYLGARRARLVGTISDNQSREARENWRIPRGKLVNLGLGIDEAYFGLIDTSRSESQATGERLCPRFISISRITLPQKPLHLVAEALAALPIPWESWTIVGTGPDEEAFKVRLEELGIIDRTIFLGTQDSRAIVELLRAHDLALLPSNYESFFYTTYEAAALGKIVVTNDVADVRSYFAESRSVIVAESASPAAYQAAILRALANFQELSASAKTTAERVKRDYSWEHSAARFLRAVGKVRSDQKA